MDANHNWIKAAHKSPSPDNMCEPFHVYIWALHFSARLFAGADFQGALESLEKLTICEILEGSLSALSKPIFASEYSFCSMFQALQDLRTFPASYRFFAATFRHAGRLSHLVLRRVGGFESCFAEVRNSFLSFLLTRPTFTHIFVRIFGMVIRSFLPLGFQLLHRLQTQT